MEKKQALIFGGTSGLGLELASQLKDSYEVTVTGRRGLKRENIWYVKLDLRPSVSLSNDLDQVIQQGPVDLLIYAPGFYQEGMIDNLSDEQIDTMNSVGLGACQKILTRILRKQGRLDGFIAITSTSEWTPRLKEPVYNGVKAGLKMFAEAVSLDLRIGKTLVAAPAGMQTEFWRGTDRDTSTMLDPKWVAKQILALYADEFRYCHARILRDPARVEVTAKRKE